MVVSCLVRIKQKQLFHYRTQSWISFPNSQKKNPKLRFNIVKTLKLSTLRQLTIRTVNPPYKEPNLRQIVLKSRITETSKSELSQIGWRWSSLSFEPSRLLGFVNGIFAFVRYDQILCQLLKIKVGEDSVFKIRQGERERVCYRTVWISCNLFDQITCTILAILYYTFIFLPKI